MLSQMQLRVAILTPSTRKLNRKHARLADVFTAANAASVVDDFWPSSAVCTVTAKGAAAARVSSA